MLRSDPVFGIGAVRRSLRPLSRQGARNALRAISDDQVPAVVAALSSSMARRACPGDLAASLFESLFNQVALSPYTDFAGRLVSVLLDLAAPDCLGPAAIADVLSYMLRHFMPPFDGLRSDCLSQSWRQLPRRLVSGQLALRPTCD